MSRSYKKYPLVKYERNCKFGKRQANKKLRNLPLTEKIPSGGKYKRHFNSYDICDFRCVEFKQWRIEKWYSKQKDELYGVKNFTHWADKDNTLEEELSEWKKEYLSK